MYDPMSVPNRRHSDPMKVQKASFRLSSPVDVSTCAGSAACAETSDVRLISCLVRDVASDQFPGTSSSHQSGRYWQLVTRNWQLLLSAPNVPARTRRRRPEAEWRFRPPP